jgi:hypothetical protein
VLVGNGRDDQLVGFGGVAETLQLVRDLARGTDELGVDTVGDQLAVSVAPDVASSLLGSGELDIVSYAQRAGVIPGSLGGKAHRSGQDNDQPPGGYPVDRKYSRACATAASMSPRLRPTM